MTLAQLDAMGLKPCSSHARRTRRRTTLATEAAPKHKRSPLSKDKSAPEQRRSPNSRFSKALNSGMLIPSRQAAPTSYLEPCSDVPLPKKWKLIEGPIESYIEDSSLIRSPFPLLHFQTRSCCRLPRGLYFGIHVNTSWHHSKAHTKPGPIFRSL